MFDIEKKIHNFLGLWELIPESCKFQQGETPLSGSYKIEYVDGRLVFTMHWTNKNNESNSVVFSGKPDGMRVPFNGGDLADEMSICAVSTRELNSYAYLKGKELMVAQRQLDDTGLAMRITQLVRLPDGTNISNESIYRRSQSN